MPYIYDINDKAVKDFLNLEFCGKFLGVKRRRAVSSAVAVGSSCSSSSRVVASTIFYVSFVGEFGQSLSYVFEEIFIFLFCLENAEEDDDLI